MRSKVEPPDRKGRRKVRLTGKSDSGRIHVTEVIAEFSSSEEAAKAARELAEDLKRERPSIPAEPRRTRDQ
jgi:hypothetical protein